MILGDTTSTLRKGPQQHIFNYRQKFSEYNLQVQSPPVHRYGQYET